MTSPESSTSSIASTDSNVASVSTDATSPCSPCSRSILLNPLVPASPRKKTVLISISPSAPPPHFLAENPSYFFNSSPPSASVDMHSRSSSADPAYRSASPGGASSVGAASDDPDAKGRLKFAPLPPGRRMFRSNSLSIGVAARAKMIQSQGAPTQVSHPRYGGPQQWYQTGGTVPPDVYTYKDLQKGVGKMWEKVRRRSSVSNASRSSAEAQVMERDGKGKSKEIEHIEEASDEDDSGDEDAVGSEDDWEAARGRPNALSLDGMDSLSSLTPPHRPNTPDRAVILDHVPAPSPKGKGVARPTRAVAS